MSKNENLYIVVSKLDKMIFLHKISADKSNIYFFKSRDVAEKFKLKHLYKPKDFEIVESIVVDVDQIIDSIEKNIQIDRVVIE